MKPELEKHIQECETCLRFVALCMVSPFRGHPTQEDKCINNLEQIIQRLRFWKHNKELLVSHGVNYSPAGEKIMWQEFGEIN